LILTVTRVYGQPGRYDDHPHDGPPPKIEELYKIKLIETLQMDEETTLKFFSRQSKNKEEMKKINDKGDEILDQLKDKIDSGSKEEISSLVNAYLKNEDDLNSKRGEFINSLYDILTPAQVAKFMVFERRFREEIRDILIKDRRRGRD
jgi:hypothetical protein